MSNIICGQCGYTYPESMQVIGLVHNHDEEILSNQVDARENTDKVNRIEVIDGAGRAYVKGSIYGSPVSVELSYQDDDRTLKVFVKELEKQREATE